MRSAAPEVSRLCGVLSQIYHEQKATGFDSYMEEHAREPCVRHQVEVFDWYRSFLPNSGVVLDWGCNHGPDSCLLREVYGNKLELHGCDYASEHDFPVFRRFGGLNYRRLTDPVVLPYNNDYFDVVIGSGALEHTAMDGECLKQLYRVLKPGGKLIITYLPYRFSFDEWYRRTILKTAFHRRLYDRRDFDRLLKGCGFYPLKIDFHTFVPRFVRPGLPRHLYSLKEAVKRWFCPPWYHATLLGVAEKIHCM